MSKFKIGDKVRFIADHSPNAKFFVYGLTGLTILEVDQYADYSGDCRVAESIGRDNWFVGSAELELDTTEELTEEEIALKCLLAVSKIEVHTMSYEGMKRTPALYDNLDYLTEYFINLLKKYRDDDQGRS